VVESEREGRPFQKMEPLLVLEALLARISVTSAVGWFCNVEYPRYQHGEKQLAPMIF
jgi:hypothetical protein